MISTSTTTNVGLHEECTQPTTLDLSQHKLDSVCYNRDRPLDQLGQLGEFERDSNTDSELESNTTLCVPWTVCLPNCTCQGRTRGAGTPSEFSQHARTHSLSQQTLTCQGRTRGAGAGSFSAVHAFVAGHAVAARLRVGTARCTEGGATSAHCAEGKRVLHCLSASAAPGQMSEDHAGRMLENDAGRKRAQPAEGVLQRRHGILTGLPAR